MIIDVETKTAKRMFNELKKRKSTFDIEGPYIYNWDPTYSQIHIDTLLTEDEMDALLCKVGYGAGYIGVIA